jgi:sulfite reductase (NADPH) hemoprotein beta-component
MPQVVEKLISVYLSERNGEERFIDTVRRLGIAPFKAHVYADKNVAKAEGLA